MFNIHICYCSLCLYFTFVVEQKTFILSRSGNLIFAEIAPHFAENIDSFSAHPIRLTFDGDGSNFLLIHLITPTFGFKSGLSHKILQPSAPQIVVTPKDNINFKIPAFSLYKQKWSVEFHSPEHDRTRSKVSSIFRTYQLHEIRSRTTKNVFLIQTRSVPEILEFISWLNQKILNQMNSQQKQKKSRNAKFSEFRPCIICNRIK